MGNAGLYSTLQPSNLICYMGRTGGRSRKGHCCCRTGDKPRLPSQPFNFLYYLILLLIRFSLDMTLTP